MTWQPLSVRQGRRKADGPFEGVPAHLQPHLRQWLNNALSSQGYLISVAIQAIALRLRIPVPGDEQSASMQFHYLIEACEKDPDLFLDAVDMALNMRETDWQIRESLTNVLTAGGSVWTVASDGESLQRRLDASTQAQADVAMTPNDAASEELKEAWSKIYGRQPDPSDAWDHAIKAAEAIMRPLVSPANTRTTLGSIVRDIKAKGSKCALVLNAQNTDGVDTLVHMLDLLWALPNRHGGSTGGPPTRQEAEAAVQLAVTVVQWIRAGALSVR